MITTDDVILALSWSGETAELKNLINYSRRFRIGLIAVTSEANSTLGAAADVVLTLPKAREACPHNLAPTTSSVMQLALGDALMVALLESRGFTALDFGALHPSGKLGAMLKVVRDLMHKDTELPIKPLGTKMSDALVEMTSKGFGCVGIIDTRGEMRVSSPTATLRRHMRPDLMAACVDDVMTGIRRPSARICSQAKRWKSSTRRRSRRCSSLRARSRSASFTCTTSCAQGWHNGAAYGFGKHAALGSSGRSSPLAPVEAAKLDDLQNLLVAVMRLEIVELVSATCGAQSFKRKVTERKELGHIHPQARAIRADDFHVTARRRIRARYTPDRIVDPHRADAIDNRLLKREHAPDQTFCALVEEWFVGRPGVSAGIIAPQWHHRDRQRRERYDLRLP